MASKLMLYVLTIDCPVTRTFPVSVGRRYLDDAFSSLIETFVQPLNQSESAKFFAASILLFIFLCNIVISHLESNSHSFQLSNKWIRNFAGTFVHRKFDGIISILTDLYFFLRKKSFWIICNSFGQLIHWNWKWNDERLLWLVKERSVEREDYDLRVVYTPN